MTAAAEHDLDLIIDAARAAGAVALNLRAAGLTTTTKADHTPVSNADLAVDALLRDQLGAARPDYGWLSEETADDHARLAARRTFVVDPIDGTRGFLDGLHSWCVSVAVVEDGRSLAGVLECPAKRETYWALPGEGAYLNDRRIHVRPIGDAVDMGGPKPLVDLVPEPWQGRLRRTAYIPSLAYRLAMIAAGKLDATFVKPSAHDWDIAAADLILTEAGGALVDRSGAPPRYAGEIINHGALAAGSGKLLGVLTGVLAGLDEG